MSEGSREEERRTSREGEHATKGRHMSSKRATPGRTPEKRGSSENISTDALNARAFLTTLSR